MVNVENLIKLATLVRDETANKQNTALRVGGTFLEVVYAIRSLLETVGELDTLATALDNRTRFFHGYASDVDALKNITDLGVYVARSTGWTGVLSVQFDFNSTVSQVALSSSTPDYSEGSLVWKPAPCVMFRTYTDGAWSQWRKAGADVVNDLVTGGVDRALSAEQGKALKDGIDALGLEVRGGDRTVYDDVAYTQAYLSKAGDRWMAEYHLQDFDEITWQCNEGYMMQAMLVETMTTGTATKQYTTYVRTFSMTFKDESYAQIFKPMVKRDDDGAITEAEVVENITLIIRRPRIVPDTTGLLGRMDEAETSIATLTSDVQSVTVSHSELAERLYINRPLVLSSDCLIDAIIHTSTFKWYLSNKYKGVVVPMFALANAKICVTKNPNGACRFAFLRADFGGVAEDVKFCEGQSLIEQTDTEPHFYSVPTDCTLMYVYTLSDGTDVTPSIEIFLPIDSSMSTPGFKRESSVDISQYQVQTCSLGSSSVGWYLYAKDPIQSHIAIPVVEGESYRLTTDIDGFAGFLTSSYSPPYVRGDAIPYVSGYNRITVLGGVSQVVSIPSGCAFLVLTLVDGAGNTLNWTVEVGQSEKYLNLPMPIKLRVAHWNVGHFALGAAAHPSITHDDYAAMRLKWANAINDIGADILMCCEYSPNIVDADGDNAAISARTAIFPVSVYPYAYIGSRPSANSYMMTAIFCKTPLHRIRERIYAHTVQAGRYYQAGTMLLNGRYVQIAETHLDWDQGTNGATYRAEQIQELIAAFSSYEHVIIAADFNVTTPDEYDAFVQAGFSMVNHAYLGDLPTYHAGADAKRPIDNILIKGFAINSVRIINDATLSDHCGIYADLTMII